MFLELCHVQVLVSESLGLVEPNAIDDRSMVQGVADHSIFWPENSLEEACVGVKPTGKQNGVLHFIVVGNYFLQILVDVLSAANEADRTHSEAMAIQGPLGGLDETRMVRQTKVVVGTKV